MSGLRFKIKLVEESPNPITVLVFINLPYLSGEGFIIM